LIDEMPLYDIEHVTPLTDAQQEQLAIALTDLHVQRFKTPRFFINVRYTDVSAQVVFRGGVRRKYNRIIIRTRAGSNRSTEMYNDHCRDIVRVWERVIGDDTVPERGLRTVWVLGALTTALEAGIARPKVRHQDNLFASLDS
jgi:phenylpyruvate tautomerase PptA (4-oxalocrotonate tautomerase family)